jgi:hypothetical protein
MEKISFDQLPQMVSNRQGGLNIKSHDDGNAS